MVDWNVVMSVEDKSLIDFELLVGRRSTGIDDAVVNVVKLLVGQALFSEDTVVHERVVIPSKLVGALLTVTAT